MLICLRAAVLWVFSSCDIWITKPMEMSSWFLFSLSQLSGSSDSFLEAIKYWAWENLSLVMQISSFEFIRKTVCRTRALNSSMGSKSQHTPSGEVFLCFSKRHSLQTSSRQVWQMNFAILVVSSAVGSGTWVPYPIICSYCSVVRLSSISCLFFLHSKHSFVFS